MMLAADVYDVSHATSAVSILHEHGADPWVVDFGAPEREEGGLERTLADHVVAISEAVDRVRQATGRDVHLGGYSQGGMFCYQTAAYRRNEGLGSLITFGSPVDTRQGTPFGIPEYVASGRRGTAGRSLLPRLGAAGLGEPDRLHACLTRSSRRATGSSSSSSSTIARRCSRARVSAGSSRPTAGSPGRGRRSPTSCSQFIAHNRLLEGGFVVDGRLLSLADIACPILSVVGTVDEIAPAAGVRAIRAAAPRADVYELALAAGHFGLVVGSTSNTVTWPTVASWVRWRDGEGERPGGDHRGPRRPDAPIEPHVRSRVGYGLELAGAVSSAAPRARCVSAATADHPRRARS